MMIFQVPSITDLCVSDCANGNHHLSLGGESDSPNNFNGELINGMGKQLQCKLNFPCVGANHMFLTTTRRDSLKFKHYSRCEKN